MGGKKTPKDKAFCLENVIFNQIYRLVSETQYSGFLSSKLSDFNFKKSCKFSQSKQFEENIVW